MSWLSDLFRDTLKPTERELLEAEAAWWKDSSGYWQAALKQADADAALWRDEYENTRQRVARLSAERDDLLIDRRALRDALIDINVYTHGQKSGTAQKVNRMCKDALK